MLRIPVLAAVLLTAFAVESSAQWLEELETYSPGPLDPQSDWELGSPFFNDVDVSNVVAFRGSQSMYVDGDDLGSDWGLYLFSNLAGGSPTGGHRVLSGKVFVPATSTGWFIVDVYNRWSTPGSWSVQMIWDLDVDLLKDNMNQAGNTSVRRDEWVSFVICIDLENDRHDIIYGDQILVSDQPWMGAGGDPTVDGIGLRGFDGPFKLTGVYVDDLRIETSGGPTFALTSNPSPAQAGQPVTLDILAPNLPANQTGLLTTWTVNGSPFFQNLLTFQLSAGAWSLTSNVPPNFSGLEIGLKAMAVVPGEGLSLSNMDVLVVP